MRGKIGQAELHPGVLDILTISRVMHSKGREAFGAEEKAFLRSAFSGALLTTEKLHDWGLAASPLCSWCGKQNRLQHRIFEQTCGDCELRKLRQE